MTGIFKSPLWELGDIFALTAENLPLPEPYPNPTRTLLEPYSNPTRTLLEPLISIL